LEGKMEERRKREGREEEDKGRELKGESEAE
jgi:hypothetical protein